MDHPLIDCHAHIIPPHVDLTVLCDQLVQCSQRNVYVVGVSESSMDASLMLSLWQLGQSVKESATHSDVSHSLQTPLPTWFVERLPLDLHNGAQADPSTWWQLGRLYYERVLLCTGVHPMQANALYSPVSATATLSATNSDSNATVAVQNSVVSTPEVPKYRSAQLDDLSQLTNILHTHCTHSANNSTLTPPPQMSLYKFIVGVGEIGLDFSPHVLRGDYYLATHQPPGSPNTSLTKKECDERAKLNQQTVFRRQVEWAAQYGLTLNIHSRQAGKYAIQLLKELAPQLETGGLSLPPVLLHAFDGKLGFVQQALDLGCYFSVAPYVLYASKPQGIVQLVPLDRLVLESDTPSLGPDPQHTDQNQPSNIHKVAEYIARVKQVTVEQVAYQTTRNAACLFPKLIQHWTWLKDYQ
ncbi:putative deoxyribonuclease tatdn3 [Dispira parvispora]|uniref:Deoxyribonuclease tatdn3 n=1 Tax=Dispira parvispora TaxID=1520584 RepID=A0A9W8AJV4_9FUNG|nr:putative deoxyribonuclease tatdn3 [Dispira parvispora]